MTFVAATPHAPRRAEYPHDNPTAREGVATSRRMEPIAMWTAFQLADFLNVRPSRVYDLVRFRQVPVTRIGKRQLRFERAAIRLWIDARTTQAQAVVS